MKRKQQQYVRRTEYCNKRMYWRWTYFTCVTIIGFLIGHCTERAIQNNAMHINMQLSYRHIAQLSLFQFYRIIFLIQISNVIFVHIQKKHINNDVCPFVLVYSKWCALMYTSTLDCMKNCTCWAIDKCGYKYIV